MKHTIYLKENVESYIQGYMDKHNISFSGAISLLVEEHELLEQRTTELSKQAQENKDLVTLYTQIKDNMVKLYDYVKNKV